SHDGDVFTGQSVAVDRTKSSPRRQWADCRAGERLGWLLGTYSQKQRSCRRGVEELRLLHRGMGKMAQHSGRGDDRGRAVRELAEFLRVRIFLRLSRRRSLAV